MTTIIAQNGKLAADRRKAVNHYKTGIIGVRNESKIVKLPFCLYATMGYDLPSDTVGEENVIKDRVTQQLAVLFALSYFCGKRFYKTPLYRYLKESKIPTAEFSINVRSLRLIIGKFVSIEMDEAGRGLLAMDGHTTLFMEHGNFNAYNNKEIITAGSGRKVASILIDKGWKLEDIYKAVRTSGAPTGAEFEVYDTRKEFADEFPPIGSLDFLLMFSALIKSYAKNGVAEKNLTPETANNLLLTLTTVIAGFMSIGKLHNGKVIFNKKQKLYYYLPQDADAIAFKLACTITRYKPIQEESK